MGKHCNWFFNILLIILYEQRLNSKQQGSNNYKPSAWRVAEGTKGCLDFHKYQSGVVFTYDTVIFVSLINFQCSL